MTDTFGYMNCKKLYCIDRRETHRRQLRGKTNRRTGERRIRQCILASILIVSILLIITQLQGQLAQASAGSRTVTQYRSLEVKTGDTLWKIAEEYGDGRDLTRYMDEIRHINHINDDMIHAGAYLTIPYEVTVKD